MNCNLLHCILLHYFLLHCTILHCILLNCTILHCTELKCTLLHCTVLYCTVIYYTAIYCTVLYCTTNTTYLGPIIVSLQTGRLWFKSSPVFKLFVYLLIRSDRISVHRRNPVSVCLCVFTFLCLQYDPFYPKTPISTQINPSEPK